MDLSIDYETPLEEHLQEHIILEQLKYWKELLEHAPTILTLPTDHPRPPFRTNREAGYSFALTNQLTNALKVLSHQQGVSLYTILVAAFQTLLHRYTGQDDVLIGSRVAGRHRIENEMPIDHFSNIVVLRTDLSGNPSFCELLERVQHVVYEAQEHQDVPLEYLLNELHIEKNNTQPPLFQTMLLFDAPAPELLSAWAVTQLTAETSATQVDLTLKLEDRSEGLSGRFEYNTDLFDATTIERMSGHLQTLLESIVTDPNQPIGTIPILTEEERHQLLAEWNNTEIEYPLDKCIHQLFEEQVERTPDKVAVTFEGKSLTYRELNNRANQLAHFLQRYNVGPDVPVGIYLERSLNMVVGLLSILKAGGAYVPLDTTYPIERLSFMLEDTHAPVLITQEQYIPNLPAYAGHIVCLDSDKQEIARESEENPVTAITGACLAYVIYTSGSTGKPKGVLINHGSVTHLAETVCNLYQFNQDDVWCLFHSYAFDFSVWELWNPLLSGGRVVIVPYEVSRSTEAFYDLLRIEQVTVLNQCPSAFHQLIRAEEALGTAQSLSLRLIIFGCEALEARSLKPWLDRQRDKAPQLVVMYGPTETTVFVTYYPLITTYMEHATGSTIGRPLLGSQIYILDQYLQPVPVGVPGEIYIGGTGLARGYLHRPELTAERFVPHPFSQKLDARLYKTGDLARFLPDGNVEFLGRIDHQVKIRGFRVELGEIDAVLSQHPSVAQEVVIVREDTPGDKRLVAYIVTAQGNTPDAQGLRSYLAERLPAYMVPSAFVFLEALPLTHNSKVDRRALPAPQRTERVTGETYVPPTSTVQKQLVHIWEELLETQPVGIKDNFFDLGGHSLLAARMVEKFEQVSGKKLALTTIFAGPTIEQISDALQSEKKVNSSPTPIIPVQTGGSKRPLFYLHGDWTGGAFYCFHLARELGTDQPFYALEPYQLDDRSIPPSLETIAATHIEAIRTIQPEGPYLFAGWCNGGLVAYEIARQLRAAGEAVDLLVLLDPMYLGCYSPRRFVRVIVNQLGTVLGIKAEKQLSWFLRLLYLSDPLLNVYCRLLNVHHEQSQDSIRLIIRDTLGFALSGVTSLVKQTLQVCTHRLSPRQHQDTPSLTRQNHPQNYSGLIEWVDMGYKPSSPYPGKITFFWASKEPWHVVSKGWLKVAEAKDAQDIEEYFIPGDQETWRNEHLHALAERLKSCLDKVQPCNSYVRT